MSSIQPDIADDGALKARVRSTTLYADDQQQGISSGDLDNHVANAKLRLSNEGVSNFYGDHGVQMAMLYATSIEAKLAIENYSVTRWDIPAGSIDVSGAGDADQAQFERWAQSVATGLQNSDEVDVSAYPTNINSANFIQ